MTEPRGCDYERESDDDVLICEEPATHVCLVERIGYAGPQSRPEDRCSNHAGAQDVIEAWTYSEWNHHDNPREKGDDDGVEYADPRDHQEERFRE